MRCWPVVKADDRPVRASTTTLVEAIADRIGEVNRRKVADPANVPETEPVPTEVGRSIVELSVALRSSEPPFSPRGPGIVTNATFLAVLPERMYDQILVPTDGDGPAKVALEYGAKLAARLGATVHVLHVTEAPLEEGETDALDGTGDRERTGEAIPDRAGEWVRAEGVTVVDAVRSGDPLEEIPDYAREEGIDAIVMGTHGRTGIERFVLGSVTEHVVRTAAIPVLVVRGDDDVRTHLPDETVVVPIDDSEHAEVALEEGIEVATRFDATLHVLSVVDVSPTGLEPQVDLQVNRLEEGAQRVVDDAAERATARGVDVVSSMSFGSIHREITSYAVDNDADLLVMGTHGRSGLDRYLLGSVTERVLRTAPAPVLTVQARDSE